MPNFGRYLFPVLPSIALLLFTGLSAWLPRRHHRHLALGVTAGMLLLGIAGLVCFLAPAYARPPIYDAAAAPEPTYPLDRTYWEDGEPLARLIGYDLEPTSVEPGGTVRVTLYWEVLGETDENYVLFAQLFGREGAKVGQRDTYPGLGHYPTSFWKPGQVILDEIPIPVNPEAVAPSRLRLDAGLYDLKTGERLTVTDGAGQPIPLATIGWLKLAPVEEPPPPANPTDFRLGGSIALTGYDLSEGPDGLRLTLHWTCLAPMDRDYTVFVHLTGPDGTLVAQADGPPMGGDYPTSLWAPDEVVVDERAIPAEEVPPGTYRLYVGMYLLETGERLPAFDAGGTRLSNDAIPLTEVIWP